MNSNYPRFFQGIFVALFLISYSALGVNLHGQQSFQQFDFENTPDYIPGWGAGYNTAYKGATAWEVPFKITLTHEDPHSGSASLCVTTSTSAIGTIRVFSPGITVPPDSSQLNASLYVRTKDLGVYAVGVGFLEKVEGGSLIYLGGKERLKILPSSKDWTKVELPEKLDPKTKSFQVMFTVENAAASGKLYLDDLNFTFSK